MLLISSCFTNNSIDRSFIKMRKNLSKTKQMGTEEDLLQKAKEH